MRLTVDTRQISALARQLDVFASKAMPYAARNYVNRAASTAKDHWSDEIREEMILRNTWTLRTLMVRRATGTNAAKMFSVVGSTADYMRTQEFGGKKSRRGKHGVAIPTSSASGEASLPRRRLVRGPNKLGAIKLGVRPGSSQKQRNAIAVRQAIASGRRFAFLQTARHSGLFRIKGGKRHPRVDMIWDASRPSVTIPRNPTLELALRKTTPRLPAVALIALREQASRHKLFGY
jgi:hypothetical protein